MAMRRTASSPDLTDTNLQSASVENSTQQPDHSTKQRRTRRCAGCHEEHATHSWGIPGPNCQGREEHVPLSRPASPKNSSPFKIVLQSGQNVTEDPSDDVSEPSSPPNKNAFATASSEKQLIEEKLRALALEQEELEELANLRTKLAQKEAAVSKLRQASNKTKADQWTKQPALPQQLTAATTTAATATTSTIRALGAKSSRPSQPFNAPQDPSLHNLLSIPSTSGDGVSIGPGLAWQAEISAGHPTTSSLHERFAANSENHSNMFLAPAAVPQGERVLRIVDFLSNIVPKESEKTLTDLGGSRLVISYGQHRPRLESVTLSQWVVANTRIFHNLLFANKLPTSRDLRDYLAYTVKIMELAGKYEWVSVLKFDDEYRQLQATYSFPWSHDSHHLHEVTLVPMAKSKPSAPQQSPQNAVPARQPPPTYSVDGRVVCRNFNSKGCHMPNCSFAHVCSQKFKGKVCSGSHPATQHGSQGGSSK